MTEKNERVWKLTMYMTDRQWEELSKWSAPMAAAKETAAWLLMEHEPSPEGEYEKKRQEVERSIPEELIYSAGE
jgi:hypothetical protein